MAHYVNAQGVWHEVDDRGRATALKDRPDRECNGNACGDISFEWIAAEMRWKITNNSDRRIRLRIRWAVGWTCGGWSEIDFNPKETKYQLNANSCPPYEANYI